MNGDERMVGTAERLEGELMEAWFEAARRHLDGDEGAAFVRAGLAGGRVRLFASAPIPHSLANRAIGLGSAQVALDALSEPVDAFVATHARAGLWLDLPALRSSRWDEWLRARTALPTGVGKFVLVHGGGLAPVAPTRLRVSRIAGHEAEDVGRLLARGLGLPSEASAPFGGLLATPGWHVFVAREDDRPVAAATLYLNGNQALLGPAATEPAARREGAHLGLTATMIRATADLGGRTLFATVPDAGSGDGAPLLRNLARCGFRLLATTAGFALPPGPASAAPRVGAGAPLRSPRHPRERRRESAHASRAQGDDRSLARDR